MPKKSSFPREQKCDLFPLFPLYPRKQSHLAVICTFIPPSATFLNPAEIVFVNRSFLLAPADISTFFIFRSFMSCRGKK